MTPAQFRDIRRALGWTQKELASGVGVASARTVRRWELGERKIPEPVARLLRVIHGRRLRTKKRLGLK